MLESVIENDIKEMIAMRVDGTKYPAEKVTQIDIGYYFI